MIKKGLVRNPDGTYRFNDEGIKMDDNDWLRRGLEVIEGLALQRGGEFATEFLARVYRIAHAALGDCPHPHRDWRIEITKLHKELRSNGII